METFSRKAIWVLIISALLFISGRASLSFKRHGSLATVESLDLDRFAGTWFVYASKGILMDQEAFNSKQVYARDTRGLFEMTYYFNKKSFEGKAYAYTAKIDIDNLNTNADWGLQFVWPFETDYRVIYLRPDYKIAMVAHPNREHIYILSRTKTMTDAEYQWLLDFAASRGFDASYIRRVPQK